MKNYKGYRRIDCQCGIYDTEYTAVYHRDGSITVNRPSIKWHNNNGNLVFEKIKITDKNIVSKVKQMFTENELVLDSGLILDDLLGR